MACCEYGDVRHSEDSGGYEPKAQPGDNEGTMSEWYFKCLKGKMQNPRVELPPFVPFPFVSAFFVQRTLVTDSRHR